MMTDDRNKGHNDTVIINTNARDFFRGRVMEAVANQQLEAAEETMQYVVNLLVSFGHTEQLFERTTEGLTLKPLAFIYADAVEAPSAEHRNEALKRLGDVALFICGIFPHSLNRKLVDVDYYIAMGGNAYGYLSESAAGAFRWRAFQAIFDELSAKFTAFVDVLGEVTEHAHFHRNVDTLRLYEVWARTGSKRLARQLARQGIAPIAGSISKLHH